MFTYFAARTVHTIQVTQKIAEHNSSDFRGYTSSRLPVELVFCEEFPSRDDAFLAERRIKGWGRKKKEALIRGDWDEISRLAQKKR